MKNLGNISLPVPVPVNCILKSVRKIWKKITLVFQLKHQIQLSHTEKQFQKSQIKHVCQNLQTNTLDYTRRPYLCQMVSHKILIKVRLHQDKNLKHVLDIWMKHMNMMLLKQERFGVLVQKVLVQMFFSFKKWFFFKLCQNVVHGVAKILKMLSFFKYYFMHSDNFDK